MELMASGRYYLAFDWLESLSCCHAPSRSRQLILFSLGDGMKRLAIYLAVIAANHCFAAPDPVRLKYEPTEPMFLIPVSPHGRDYQDAVENILNQRWGLGTMVYETAGEFFAVSVWGKDYANYDHDHPLHSFITYLKLDGAGADAKATKDIDVLST
jgi:hypothetical protein